MIDITVDITADNTQAFREGLAFLENHRVLVGIPEGSEPREDGSEITNVELAFIMTYGSPLKKIPPRPFIEPAIEDATVKAQLAREMGNAARQALNGEFGSAMDSLGKAGLVGQGAVQEKMGGTPPPNAPSTIRQKKAKVRNKKDREATSPQTLIDTTNLRGAITYVVEGD